VFDLQTQILSGQILRPRIRRAQLRSQYYGAAYVGSWNEAVSSIDDLEIRPLECQRLAIIGILNLSVKKPRGLRELQRKDFPIIRHRTDFSSYLQISSQRARDWIRAGNVKRTLETPHDSKPILVCQRLGSGWFDPVKRASQWIARVGELNPTHYKPATGIQWNIERPIPIHRTWRTLTYLGAVSKDSCKTHRADST